VPTKKGRTNLQEGGEGRPKVHMEHGEIESLTGLSVGLIQIVGEEEGGKGMNVKGERKALRGCIQHGLKKGVVSRELLKSSCHQPETGKDAIES